MKIRDLSKAALVSALLCIISPFTIPAGVVPLSLSTFMVFIAAIILKPAYATAAVAVYIMLGAFGLPVFSGANGGIGVFFGATGGFLTGYVPGVFAASFLKNKIGIPLSLIIATFIIYVFGIIWLAVVTGNTLLQSAFVCIPFLPGDALKIVGAYIIGVKIGKSNYRIPM